jgi:hypothetical protein
MYAVLYPVPHTVHVVATQKLRTKLTVAFYAIPYVDTILLRENGTERAYEKLQAENRFSRRHLASPDLTAGT